MRSCPSLVLILSLAACEHASTATQPSTLTAEVGVVESKATAPEAAPPEAPAPAAAMVAPRPAPEAKTVAPVMRPKLVPDCTHYRATRAAPKWNADCERPRVTKKPATAGDPAPAAQPEAARP